MSGDVLKPKKQIIVGKLIFYNILGKYAVDWTT